MVLDTSVSPVLPSSSVAESEIPTEPPVLSPNSRDFVRSPEILRGGLKGETFADQFVRATSGQLVVP